MTDDFDREIREGVCEYCGQADAALFNPPGKDWIWICRYCDVATYSSGKTDETIAYSLTIRAAG